MPIVSIITSDEWYPMCDFRVWNGKTPYYGSQLVEISDETFARWNKIMEEFWELQNELKEQ